ncbi:MAG TPA: sulfur oxidation c-type cytochrome SoxX [Burkholderiales bacterium]|nr:sulfur oxidation c-type cytochrome SoxX [Burkholderiales bacterium]
MRKRLSSLAFLAVAACASGPSDDGARQRAEQAFRESFTHGNRQMAAKVDQQDEVQAQCTRYRNEPPKEVADRIESAESAGIRYPASGRLLGDWRKGERIAQDAYGLRFTDPDTKRPNGGGCYNCHRIAPAEISYGTVGPSLYRLGAQRGAGEPAQRYVYGKIYDSQAFLACSHMPRFGRNGILTEEQITHLVALLLDPESPVNK